MKPPTPKRKKQSKTDSVNDSQLQAALNFLQQPDDPTLIYTQHLANKLRQFSGRTRAMIEHNINQIIFEAEMGHYDNPHFRTQVPTPAFFTNTAQGSPWSSHSYSSSNDNPHFRTQIPTPASSPNAAQGSPWSAHSNSSSKDNPHFRTLVPTPASSPNAAQGSPWSAHSNSSSNDNPHFRTQVPTPASSPNAAEGSPWSAHTNSSSNSAQPDEQAQEEDNLLTVLRPFITL
ncbi:unnamed protein product [Brassicogethes aeneus]|uniref:BESS domain-containing protein n=1 Tax=Brassicogethes aeneus TaxID=1431903 RepID=A0A9P0FG71_BRAAE|nr:unnamed protein product [Brassicogethes aeneus]